MNAYGPWIAGGGLVVTVGWMLYRRGAAHTALPPTSPDVTYESHAEFSLQLRRLDHFKLFSPVHFAHVCDACTNIAALLAKCTRGMRFSDARTVARHINCAVRALRGFRAQIPSQFTDEFDGVAASLQTTFNNTQTNAFQDASLYMDQHGSRAAATTEVH